jgi:hypothetical protein
MVQVCTAGRYLDHGFQDILHVRHHERTKINAVALENTLKILIEICIHRESLAIELACKSLEKQAK